MRDSNINYYEHKDIKKYLPKFKDDQLKLTGIPLTNHFGLFGATGSKKSNSLLNYIGRTEQASKEGSYDKIYMLIKKVEPFNNLLKEKLKDRIEFFFSINDFPDVSTFPDLSKKNNSFNLIIFDDFITEKGTKNLKKLDDYLIYGRSKGCTVCLLSQSYFDTSTLLRKQLSYICLCGIKSNNDLRSILREYSIGDIDVSFLRKLYDYAKQEDFAGEPTFLKIDTGTCPINKKFSRNWIEYIQIKPEKNSKALNIKDSDSENDSDSDN